MPEVEIDALVETRASQPAEVRSDAGSVREHSLPDLIAAEKFVAGKTLVKHRTSLFSRIFCKMKPPGA